MKVETPRELPEEEGESAMPKSEDSHGKEKDQRGDLGTTGALQEGHGMAREGTGAVDLGESDNGQGMLQPESSVRSRPSELFDSLDFSAS